MGIQRAGTEACQLVAHYLVHQAESEAFVGAVLTRAADGQHAVFATRFRARCSRLLQHRFVVVIGYHPGNTLAPVRRSNQILLAATWVVAMSSMKGGIVRAGAPYAMGLCQGMDAIPKSVS